MPPLVQRREDPTMKERTTGLLLPGLVLVLCAACGAPAGVVPEAVAPPGSDDGAAVVERLPLRPGYYVAADIPCGEASNATVHVLRPDGGSYGGFTTPPYTCTFIGITRAGPSSYRANEECGSDHGGRGTETMAVTYEVLSDTSYRSVNADGWESSARRCPERQLPAFWQELDLGDYVD